MCIHLALNKESDTLSPCHLKFQGDEICIAFSLFQCNNFIFLIFKAATTEILSASHSILLISIKIGSFAHLNDPCLISVPSI